MAIIRPDGSPNPIQIPPTNPLDLVHLATTGISPIVMGIYLLITISNAVNSLLTAIYSQQAASAQLLQECTKALPK